MKFLIWSFSLQEQIQGGRFLRIAFPDKNQCWTNHRLANTKCLRSNYLFSSIDIAVRPGIMLKDRIFLLDIRNDQHDVPATQYIPEMKIHRRIIEMYQRRDDFAQVDLNIRTSRSLSGNARADISNALQHMQAKGKKLRRLSADIDYIDPSIHEFILLNCLTFEEIQLISTPFEETHISVGIATSLRHALTLNQKCVRSLEISCALSEETSGILIDALKDANALEIFRLGVMTRRSNYVAGMLESLTGKPKLTELQLTDSDAYMSESLGGLLSNSICSLRELNIGYDWDRQPQFDSVQLSNALREAQCNSVSVLLFNGINFEDNCLRILPLAFPNLETLSISASRMPKLSFLDLPEEQLPRKLKSCYFPCTTLDIEEGRRLVEKLPHVVDVPDFVGDPIVQYFLDWARCGRAVDEGTAMFASLWPLILERANHIMSDNPVRCPNMIYSILQVQHRMESAGLLIYGNDDDSDVDNGFDGLDDSVDTDDDDGEDDEW